MVVVKRGVADDAGVCREGLGQGSGRGVYFHFGDGGVVGVCARAAVSGEDGRGESQRSGSRDFGLMFMVGNSSELSWSLCGGASGCAMMFSEDEPRVVCRRRLVRCDGILYIHYLHWPE